MKILVVEDEPRLRQQLRVQLNQRGYSVEAAADGEDGLYIATEYPLDLAIVDLGLPGLSGIDLIRRLRAQGRDYPVLILTARGEWQDKVEGLEAGADDYLVKPFHVEELLARLNALLRRVVGHAATPVIECGPLSLDTARKGVRVNGAPVTLTAYEYRVLEYLVLHRDKVVSKAELTEHLYEQDFDRDSNVLEVFVRRLRKKLDPEGALSPILTLRGQGYRLNPEWT